MSVNKESEREGIANVSEIVAKTLKLMRLYARPGISAYELDEYGGDLLSKYGARSAPKLAYHFPGHTCISINHEVAHGIPTPRKELNEGDLVNIDVSAELNGFWADNGGSFVLGNDGNQHQHLVDTSRNILAKAISIIKGGVKIALVGKLIEKEAKKAGYKVIKNLAGHGVGRSLHESPHEILNCYDFTNHNRFKKNSVVAVETFISTRSTIARQGRDGWTLYGNHGGFVAQHEHTILITDDAPVVLTSSNEIF